MAVILRIPEVEYAANLTVMEFGCIAVPAPV